MTRGSVGCARVAAPSWLSRTTRRSDPGKWPDRTVAQVSRSTGKPVAILSGGNRQVALKCVTHSLLVTETAGVGDLVDVALRVFQHSPRGLKAEHLDGFGRGRSEEHASELQSRMTIAD